MPENESDFLADLFGANFVADAPSGSTTYAEMVSTGSVSKMQNKELRRAMSTYAQLSANYQAVLELAREVTLSPSSVYLSSVDWNTDFESWIGPEPDPAGVVIGYRWDQLQHAQGELQAWQAMQGNLIGVYRRVLREARRVVALTRTLE